MPGHEVQPDVVRLEVQGRGHQVRVALGVHPANLTLLELKVDPVPDEVEAVLGHPPDGRGADQGAITPFPGIQPHRIRPGLEVFPIHGDTSPGEHLVLPAHPDPVGHEDVGRLLLAERVRHGNAHGGPEVGKELGLVAGAEDLAEVIERRPPQDGPAAPVGKHHIAPGLPAVRVTEVSAEIRRHLDRRIRIAHAADELDHLALVRGEAVTPHPDLLTHAPHADISAGKVVSEVAFLLGLHPLAVHVQHLKQAALLGGGRAGGGPHQGHEQGEAATTHQGT